ncbi:hypothetical protein HMP09_2360 [Sphingomonas sp. HMP9]|uniref:head maturation protease, ClpP-related n=1 Tax=Sphingomonas sp. HMP9 TaxID=1517554 RepID=UPI0015969CBF|nr:head maturation protease, ClpP-related [Sphingomonas sp. HMP9]BCA63126.1 hypothetical protein HMP09_2360 [Sphingomonas sp. HMP9]
MAEIILYGVIGDEFDKLDSKTIAPLIRAASGPLSLRINSPGGYVMEGLAIIAAIRDYRWKVTAYVDGLAASMASAIAASCDECVMAEASMLMVHNPWDVAIGDAPELRAAADKLDRIRDQLVGIYAKRSGLETDEIVAMLDAETWMGADQAVERGFADRTTADLKIAAMANVSAFGFRHAPDKLKGHHMPGELDTTQAAVTLERTRISTIMALGAKHRIPQNVTQDLVTRGIDLDQARASILDHLATDGDRHNIGHQFGGSGHQTLDDPTVRVKAMSDAIGAKLLNKPAAGASAEYRGMSLVDMARDHLSRGGVQDAYRMSADRVAAMAMQGNPFTARATVITHTTSDFPQIMQAGVDAALVARYRAQESQLKRLTAIRDAPNFKEQIGIQMSGFGSLDQVNEAGEFKNKTLSESSGSYQLQTFGNIINFSRQMLINDSLGALADIVQVMAFAASQMEATILAATINSNIPLRDGIPWFDGRHGNLAGTGGAPTIATLDAARQAMRSQKDRDNVTLIDVQPKFLLVPTGLQTAAETLVASATVPSTVTTGSGSTAVTSFTGDVANPFAGKLEPIADPRLVNPAAWYLFPDPEIWPAFVSVYLNGNREPFTESQDGFRVDGIEWKVRHDFGAGVLDPKAAYKNPGQG